MTNNNDIKIIHCPYCSCPSTLEGGSPCDCNEPTGFHTDSWAHTVRDLRSVFRGVVKVWGKMTTEDPFKTASQQSGTNTNSDGIVSSYVATTHAVVMTIVLRGDMPVGKLSGVNWQRLFGVAPAYVDNHMAVLTVTTTELANRVLNAITGC